MCSEKQIQAAVEQCLALMECGFSLQCLQENDPCYAWDFKAVETLVEEHGITGLYRRDGVLATIFFQADMSEPETYLTIGHELGHHFLHRNLRLAEQQLAQAGAAEVVVVRKIIEDERREYEAEKFAWLLLERCGIQVPDQAL